MIVTGGVCAVSVKRLCEEKQQKLAVLEENFLSTQKEVTELRSCLREVERSRLEARRELQELRRQVSTFDLNLCFQYVWSTVTPRCGSSDGAVVSAFQLKVLDGEKEQRSREVAELQTRLSLEEQREEERMKEVFIFKQKLAEAEAARDSLKKEV